MNKTRQAEQDRIDREAAKAKAKLIEALQEMDARKRWPNTGLTHVQTHDLEMFCLRLGLSAAGERAELIERIQGRIWRA